jgi:2-dehydropantoate 2-reductase
MTEKRNWPSIAVVGAGAVGGYFGGMLAAAGAPVTMIGRPTFVDAVQSNGLFLDTLRFQKSVPVEVTTEISAARGAEVVLFCVKTKDNAATARALAPHLAPGATVISLQNGVDNVEQIHAAAGIDALRAVVYVGAAIPEPGRVKHTARGDLVIGPETAQTTMLAEMFTRANIPCRISANIIGEQWTKLLCNCALNAISALGNTTYGKVIENQETCKLVEAAAQEIWAVARAAGIVMPGISNADAAVAAAMKIAAQMPAFYSSTAQDIQRGKITEIDSLNGYIARRGADLGVPVPVNHALFALVKLLERSR